MKNEKRQMYIQSAIIIACGFLGAIVIAPLLHIDTSLGMLFGGIAGLAINPILFPELRQLIFKQQKNEQWQQFQIEEGLNFKRAWLHPTRIPLVLSFGWFLGLSLFMYLFQIQFTDESGALILLSPILFLIGLSSFLTLRLNEYIDNSGHKFQGIWAILFGVLGMIFGWGGLILIWFLFIFDVK